jgi:murein L,D-transpeptidase YafK
VSGSLGPKQKQGDGQAPEGFYRVRPGQMNPASSYHLSFNLGYPNAFDRANGRTGDFLMVHGNCVSIGCFAMTDPVIEEIWTLMQAAYEAGQGEVSVHIFPFAMTAANLKAHSASEHAPFWESLAPAWTQFDETGRVPKVKVSGKSYQVLTVQ